MKKTVQFFIFCFSILVFPNMVSAQCGAVTTAAVLESCLEGGTSVTLAADISITGLTITINGNVTINTAGFDISWTGSPWNIPNNGTMTITNGGVVNKTGNQGGTSVSNFNTAGSLTNAFPSLPVELAAFKASAKGNQVALEWVTAWESNNEGFELQRTKNLKDWTVLGFVAGKGNTTQNNTYRYNDEAPLDATAVYYRLKQMDYDGHYAYSPIVVVTVDGYSKTSVFPNPATQWVQVIRNGAAEGELLVQISDAQGRLLSTQKPNTLGQIDLSSLPNGMLYLQVNSSQSREVIRVVKQ